MRQRGKNISDTRRRSLLQRGRVVFHSLRDEPEPIPFSAIRSPCNQSQALRNLLDLARKMGQSLETANKPAVTK